MTASLCEFVLKNTQREREGGGDRQYTNDIIHRGNSGDNGKKRNPLSQIHHLSYVNR